MKALSVFTLLYSLIMGLGGICVLVVALQDGAPSDVTFAPLLTIIFMFCVAIQSVYVIRNGFEESERFDDEPTDSDEKGKYGASQS
jgi:hypothetical protein